MLRPGERRLAERDVELADEPARPLGRHQHQERVLEAFRPERVVDLPNADIEIASVDDEPGLGGAVQPGCGPAEGAARGSLLEAFWQASAARSR